MDSILDQFADLLTSAVKTIAFREQRTIAIVQDQLGFALGRDGGSSIEYWRKGHLPPSLPDVEQLARALAQRGGLKQAECRRFLQYCDHPAPEPLLDDLFSSTRLGQVATSQPGSFVVGPPITAPKRFFGRIEEVAELFYVWRDAPLQHMAIKGLRRSGKTSLLHYLKQITTARPNDLRPNQKANYLKGPAPFRWVLVNFQDARQRDQEGFFRHVLRSLGIREPEQCTHASFLNVMGEHLQWPVIIMMDELEAGLASPEFDEWFWLCLRTLAIQESGGRLAYLVTGGDVPLKLARTQGASSPFFNIFRTIELGPLTEEEARELIGSSSRPFAAEDADWIVETSGRWPCLVQLLCSKRLFALERGQRGEGWREAAVRALETYSHLLQ